MTLDSGRVVILFKSPAKASHAAVFLFEANSEGGEDKRMIDAGTSELLPTGSVGRAMRVTGPGPSLCEVKGLRAGTKYTAAVCCREEDEFAFGPESPRSLPKAFAAPVSPAIPVVHPENQEEATVYFCTSHGSTKSKSCSRLNQGTSPYLKKCLYCGIRLEDNRSSRSRIQP